MFNDLENEDGIEYKIMLNDIQMATEPPPKEEPNLKKSRDERDRDFDEIEDLMQKMESAKGRKEKRRLLAMYNAKQ
jgi:hypothetical protein